MAAMAAAIQSSLCKVPPREGNTNGCTTNALQSKYNDRRVPCSRLSLPVGVKADRSGLYSARSRGQRRRLHSIIRGHTETATVVEVDRSACPSVKDEVPRENFEALDIRVGLVTDAKPVPDKEMTEKRGKQTSSRRYLELKVDIGCETRTVVSECKYVMDVEDAIGKKVLLVANVPPATIEDIQSHGVILTGLNYDPTPMPRSFKLILPGLGKLPPGSQITGAHVPR